MKKVLSLAAGGYGYNPGPAARFSPHAFRAQVSFLGQTPRILMTPEVADDIYYITDEVVETEVSFLGTVRREGLDYLITEIFLLSNQNTVVETDILPQTIAEFGMELYRTRSDAKEVANSLMLWGHSHGELEARPSTTDEGMLQKLIHHGLPFYIRLIVNRWGVMHFTVVDVERGVRMDDAPWGVVYPKDESRRERWQQEVAEKVVIKPAEEFLEADWYLPQRRF